VSWSVRIRFTRGRNVVIGSTGAQLGNFEAGIIASLTAATVRLRPRRRRPGW
jgi:hypothetical protein